MSQTPETTATGADELLDALLAHIEAEEAETVELPEPVAVIPFPTVL